MTADEQMPAPHWLVTGPRDKPTAFVIVIAARRLQGNIVESVKQLIENSRIVINSITVIAFGQSLEISVSVTTQQAWGLFHKLLQAGVVNGFDTFVTPVDERVKKLLVCDMDSTIVQTETLDEIALLAGFGEQVSRITERAMQGEIDFNHALKERVSLLAGQSAGMLTRIAESTPINAGAEELIARANAQGIRTILVSGGFEPIVTLVADKLGFDRYVCNKMEVVDGLITGQVLNPIVNSATKLKVLLEECEQLNILPGQACTIGDGANDMQMIQAAGMGVSYYGKPILRSATPYQINATDLMSVLYAMGIND